MQSEQPLWIVAFEQESGTGGRERTGPVGTDLGVGRRDHDRVRSQGLGPFAGHAGDGADLRRGRAGDAQLLGERATGRVGLRVGDDRDVDEPSAALCHRAGSNRLVTVSRPNPSLTPISQLRALA